MAWDEHGVDIVLECTGAFRTVELLEPYFERGVQKVIVSAPVKHPDVLNIVMGCNDRLYEPRRHRIVTAASCTTNCLAPVVKVLHEAIGIERGVITTMHDLTNTQVIVDAPHKDLRRARSAVNSLIPTSTGSATAITMIYPELTGKLNGLAVRVPLLNASLTDAVFTMRRDVTVDEINAALKSAADGELAGILGFEERPLVSADFTNDTRSGIVDAPSTMVVDGCMVKVLIWYDNEYGYVFRMAELAAKVAASLTRCRRTVRIRNYALVTAGYWAFTLTDGALRMLVLLHFNELGYSPVAIAFLFLAYEFMGILTNLLGGWVGSRTGLNRTLVAGLVLQIVALAALTLTQPGWAEGLTVVYVMAVQALSGIAKDLTKMSSKSAVKAIAGERRTVQARRHPHRLQERTEGRRLLPRRGAAVVARLRRVAVADGRDAHGHRGRAGVAARRGHRQGEEEGAAALHPLEVDGDQSTLRRPLLPVRVARHLVRGRAAGLPARAARVVELRHRCVPRPVDHRLRRRPVGRTTSTAPSRSAARRDPRRTALGTRSSPACRRRSRWSWPSSGVSPSPWSVASSCSASCSP